ncbi:hypothetical protein LG293_16580 (plasmid) [Citricoccus nitrophenolicus]
MTAPAPTAGVPDVKVIAQVLSEHPASTWSTGSTLCVGCFTRLKRTQDQHPAETKEGRAAAYAELVKAMDPGWSVDQWRQHVAEQIVTALNAERTKT